MWVGGRVLALAIVPSRFLSLRNRIMPSYGEIDHDFDVARLPLQGLLPLGQRDAPRDQPREPAFVGLRQRLGGHPVVRAVGVDRAENYIVVENEGAVEMADVELDVLIGAESDEANDAARRGVAGQPGDHLRR